MTKPEPENAEVDLRSRNMLEVLEALRGGIVFVKKLRPSHVPRKNCKLNGPALPKWFVEDNMEKLYKHIVLLTNKAWSLRLAVVHLQYLVPDVVFCGGWKAFAVSNNLAEGDQLVFNLSAASQFHVYIFDADGTPKAVVPPTEDPMKWTEVSELPKVNVMQSSKCKHEHMVVEERKPSANRLCGLFAKEESQELPDEHENDADEYDRDHAQREKQKLHPSFFKRLTLSNFRHQSGAPCLIVQEIPAKFARTYGSRLQSPIKLQGIFEESLVCTVTCRWERSLTRPNASLRLFLGCGWKEFGDENMLEVEQELEFTLVSDSFFVVRES